MQTGIRGINVAGYLRTESGMGSLVRRYVRALRRLDLPLALIDISELSGNRAADSTLSGFDTRAPYDVNLVCADVEGHFAVLSRLGEEFFRGRYNIGLWAWELPRFPLHWYDRFAYYDEIWVASAFIAGMLSPVSPIPVVRVPPVLTPESEGCRDAGRRRLGVADEFLFLFVFDFHSRTARKNPEAVIDAFRAAFTPGEPVRLAIKCVNQGFDQRAFEDLLARAGEYPVEFLPGYWSAGEMRDLMAACDAYVSLHRSEGLGLTIAEAMAAGKPAIATGWSGNMEFMSVANSLPVRYEAAPIRQDAGPYRAGEWWAEPSVEHAAELMRRVFDRRDQSREIGRKATEDISVHFGEEKVASLIGERLGVVGARGRFASLRGELAEGVSDLDRFVSAYDDIRPFVPEKHLGYQKLLRKIRSVVHAVLPPEATVAVVSRGDEALMALDGRAASHFPQTEQGVYAGCHPADSEAAIAHLEAVRARGGRFLLIPSTAFWWLEYYQGFRSHLEARHPCVFNDPDCVIYQLSDA